MKIPRNRNMTNIKIKMYLELSDITTSCLSATQKLIIMRVELRYFFLADLKKKKLSFQGLTSRCFTKGLETLH